MNDMFVSPQSESAMNYDDRRAFQRRDIRVNKVFSAEVDLKGELHKMKLYVADVSEGGFKITSDFPFERNVPFKGTLMFQEPFHFTAEISWVKDIGGGMMAQGIRFLEMDEHNRTILTNFIDYYTSREKSKVYRLNKIIPMRIQYGTVNPEPFYVLTIEISLMGMRIVHEERLPETEKINFKIYLDPHSKALEVTAMVHSQKEEGDLGQSFVISLDFVEMDAESKEFLTTFIDNAISGLISKKVSRPVVMFDEDS
ncbi:MAG: PilZ domain-containing protein [Candidatus Eremiobacteraeota bacterium]|nr:PilZ domain-containing protein [Candidatus Eremiobacteraeota bacterium]